MLELGQFATWFAVRGRWIANAFTLALLLALAGFADSVDRLHR